MPNVDDNNRTPDFRSKKAQESYIEALIAERKGYEARGLDDRVKQVNKQLDELGVSRDDKSTEKNDARNVPAAEHGASK